MSPSRSRRRSPTRRISLARSQGCTLRQTSKPFWAAAMAASTSCSVALAIWPSGSSVAGLMTVKVAPLEAARHLPSMYRLSDRLHDAPGVTYRERCAKGRPDLAQVRATLQRSAGRTFGRTQRDEDRSSHHGPGPGQVPDRPAHGGRRPGRAAVPRRVRHLRPRQRHLPGRGARGREGGAADLARPERAVDGARRRRLRQGQAAAPDHGRRQLDRPGRHQHGHRRRRRALEPPAGAAAVGRHLRQPPARSRAPAGRAFQQSQHQRERRVPRRDAATGTASSSRSS